MRSFPSQISFLLLLLLFATTFINRSICTTIAGKDVLFNEHDQNILLIFKQGVVNSSNRLSSWTSLEDCCLWEGVHCDNITSRVTRLDLANLELEGNSIALNDFRWLSQISSVKYLNLSWNEFGSKPKWLQHVAMLPSLSELRLAECGLIDFPSYNYVNFTYLKTLDLSGNNIISKFPDSFFNVTKDISSIDLGSNNFYGGFPIDLFKLPNLNYLSLSHNYFSGSLPESLGQLHKLSDLYLAGNSWEGVLSERNFANLTSLKKLDLSSTGFKFDFDPNWVPLFQLNYFGSENTSLGPNFPAWLYTQSSLEELWLSTSMISNIDANIFWSFIERINYVDLSNNFIGGDISNVTLNSGYLVLAYNNFIGGLPHISANVFYFRACHNSFSGSIFPLLCLPQSNGKNMSYLDLSYNHLSGILPDCWANWKQLSYLSLQGNKLTGKVPPSMASMNLEILDLHDNNLFGKFSLDLLNWTNLRCLFLEELFGTSQMRTLNLSRNKLTGKIPIEIGDVTNLESFDLSYNRLSREIPSTISNLSFLVYLNLSYNNFIGQIPLGTQIQSFDSWSFVGNHELCGDPLPRKCNKKEETHDNSKLAGGKEDDNFLKSLYLGMGVGFAVGFWGVCGSLFLIRAWRHKFFQWYDHLVDQIYVALVFYIKSFS
ncbi:hypothetical protein K1719_045564 [Acacia pycnantha]|nr:hypothetical protein K1719_045564 [Acacia pycnantha]